MQKLSSCGLQSWSLVSYAGAAWVEGAAKVVPKEVAAQAPALIIAMLLLWDGIFTSSCKHACSSACCCTCCCACSCACCCACSCAYCCACYCACLLPLSLSLAWSSIVQQGGAKLLGQCLGTKGSQTAQGLPNSSHPVFGDFMVAKLLGQCLGTKGSQTAQGHPNSSHLPYCDHLPATGFKNCQNPLVKERICVAVNRGCKCR